MGVVYGVFESACLGRILFYLILHVTWSLLNLRIYLVSFFLRSTVFSILSLRLFWRSSTSSMTKREKYTSDTYRFPFNAI